MRDKKENSELSLAYSQNNPSGSLGGTLLAC